MPEYKYPLDCDGDNLLLTLLHSGCVVMAEAYAQHMQAQKDLEALLRKMTAAIEDEDFEAAGRIKKERVAVRARMASEEAQQVRSHTFP